MNYAAGLWDVIYVRNEKGIYYHSQLLNSDGIKNEGLVSIYSRFVFKSAGYTDSNNFDLFRIISWCTNR